MYFYINIIITSLSNINTYNTLQIMFINMYYTAVESAVIINHDIIDNNDYDIIDNNDSCDDDDDS